MNLMSQFCNLLPIRRGKVVFFSFTESYADAPRAIAEEMQRCRRKVNCVWVGSKAHKPNGLPENLCMAHGKHRMCYELSTAHVIVSNTRLGKYWETGFRKKAGQMYIQTWHGSCGIKKMEGDMQHPREGYLRRSRLDSQQIDLLLSNSRWLTQVYRNSFFYDGEICECGSPRNDVLVRGTEERAAAVRAALGLPLQSKLLLYAPTFRDGEGAPVPPLPDWTCLRSILEERFGGEWNILVRTHPGLPKARRKRLPVIAGEHVLDLSNYPDMADLLAAADVMISDYSSSIYDYLLTRRPGFLFVPDREQYAEKRGLYYPLEQTPFPIAENEMALADAIRRFDTTSYRVRVGEFLRQKGCVDDGHAAERVADIIEQHLGKEVAA